MTKKEYLDKLTKELGSMSYNDVKDILSDIEDHFTVGISAGKTEEDIANDLGDPKALAADYKEGMDLPKILEKKTVNEKKPKAPEPTSATVCFCVLITVFVAIPAFFSLLGVVLTIVLSEIAIALGGIALLAFFWTFGPFKVTGLLGGLALIALAVFGYALSYFAVKYFVLGTKWYIAFIRKTWHEGL